MKNREQKWYWKILSIICIICIIVWTIWAFLWIMSEIWTYSPKTIQTVKSRFDSFEEEYWYIKKVDDKLKDVYPNFSIENLTKISYDLKLSKNLPWFMLLMILSEYDNAEKLSWWRITSVCWGWYYNDCWVQYLENKEYYDDLRFDEASIIEIPRKVVDDFKKSWIVEDTRKIVGFNEEYKNWLKTDTELVKFYESINSDFEWYKKFFPREYFYEYEHRWIVEWLKIVWFWLLAIIPYTLFLIWVTKITYIILWKFNKN